jgi:predicted dehydrogenase
MPLKIALVGCGKIADGHVEEIQKMPERARVVAVCDLEKLMAEQVATRYSIAHFYDRFEEMLERETPDVVHITTPPQSHLPLARAAVESGCHVYVEKPLALNLADSQALVASAARAGKKLTVGYTYLFDPPAIAMRELVAQGVLGDPVHIESFYGYNLAGPFGAAIMADSAHWVHRLPGKLLQNNIDHILYRIIEFIPDSAPQVRAFAHRRHEKFYGDMRDELADELRILVQGERVTAYGTFSAHIRPAGNFVRVYGTKNTLHVDYTNRTLVFDCAPTLPSAIGRLLPAFQQSRQYMGQGGKNLARFLRSDFHFFAGLKELISRFYASIEQDTEPPVSDRDILRIARMMDDIFLQIGEKKSQEEPSSVLQEAPGK